MTLLSYRPRLDWLCSIYSILSRVRFSRRKFCVKVEAKSHWSLQDEAIIPLNLLRYIYQRSAHWHYQSGFIVLFGFRSSTVISAK